MVSIQARQFPAPDGGDLWEGCCKHTAHVSEQQGSFGLVLDCERHSFQRPEINEVLFEIWWDIF